MKITDSSRSHIALQSPYILHGCLELATIFDALRLDNTERNSNSDKFSPDPFDIVAFGCDRKCEELNP